MSLGDSHSTFPKHTSLSETEAKNIMAAIHGALTERDEARELATEAAQRVEYYERRVEYLRGVARSQLGLEGITDD